MLLYAPCLYGPDNILQVADAARQAIDAGDHQHVAGPEEVEDDPQLLSTLSGRTAALLGADRFAARGSQGSLLHREILIGGADPRVPNDSQNHRG